MLSGICSNAHCYNMTNEGWEKSENDKHSKYQPQRSASNGPDEDSETVRLRRELALTRQELHDLKEWIRSKGLEPPLLPK